MNDTFSEIELRKLDLNLLLVFSALMRERGVAKAAKRLYLGPSAISMALTRLRTAMGDPLFVRARRGMDPTPTALKFWALVEPALTGIGGALHRERGFDPARAAGTVRLAVPDDIEHVLVPRLVAGLARAAPGLVLVARPSDVRALPARLDDGDAELGLSALPPTGIEARHRAKILKRESFSAVYARRHSAWRGPLDRAAYLAMPHVLLSIDGTTTGLIDAHLAELGLARRVVATVAHFATMPYILEALPVLANIPSSAAAWFAYRHDLTVSPLPFSSPRFDFAMLWHARTDLDPAALWLRAFVEREVIAVLKGPGGKTESS